MDKRVTNKYCLVVAENGDTHINGLVENARIETEQTFNEFATENELITHIASQDVDQFPVIPNEGELCEENKIYKYGTDKVKCMQQHTRMHLAPEATPALWLIIETVVGYPEWKQPTGAHDAYQTGDIVNYNGDNWISKIDANTTIPNGDEPYNRYWEPFIE